MTTWISGMQLWCSVDIEREPDNSRDVHAVAVLREGKVVSHIPYNLAPTVELFLRREVNKGFVAVNGARVNPMARNFRRRFTKTD